MSDWVIAGKPNGVEPEINKIYEIRDSRKGTFVGRIVDVDGQWAKVERLEGDIKWTSKEYQIFVGKNPQYMTIRDTLVYLIEVTEDEV